LNEIGFVKGNKLPDEFRGIDKGLGYEITDIQVHLSILPKRGWGRWF
jgi:hypothetical protein